MHTERRAPRDKVLARVNKPDARSHFGQVEGRLVGKGEPEHMRALDLGLIVFGPGRTAPRNKDYEQTNEEETRRQQAECVWYFVSGPLLNRTSPRAWLEAFPPARAGSGPYGHRGTHSRNHERPRIRPPWARSEGAQVSPDSSVNFIFMVSKNNYSHELN
jgi:hypothetical protein